MSRPDAANGCAILSLPRPGGGPPERSGAGQPVVTGTMNREQFIEWLRSDFPRLLQEDPRFSAEVVGILSQTLGSRAEFNRLLDEMAQLRQDMEQRFARLTEAMDRRFEALQREMDQRFAAAQQEMDRRFQAFQQAIDRRFEAFQQEMDRRFQAFQQAVDRRFEAFQQEMDRRFQAFQQSVDRRFEAFQQEMDRRFEAFQEQTNRRFEAIEQTLLLHGQELARHGRILRRLETGLGSLGRRFGEGFEQAVRATVEEFSGIGPLRAERLVIRDEAGELFGVPGQAVEFDAFVHDGRRFLVEVKSFAEPEDVLNFYRKMQFAKRHLEAPFEAMLIAPFALERAVQLARELGVRLLMREEEDSLETR